MPSPCSHGMEKAKLGQALLIAGHVLELPVPRNTCWPVQSNGGSLSCHSREWRRHWRPFKPQWESAQESRCHVREQWNFPCQSVEKMACYHKGKLMCNIYTVLISHRLRRNISLRWFDTPQDFENKFHHFINFEFTIFIAHWSNYWYIWFHTIDSTT